VRIATVSWTRRIVGGAETTMALSLGTLARAGHRLAMWCETDRPTDRPILPLPEGPIWCAETMGPERALAALRDWKPDLLYVHGLLDPATERQLLTVAPGVFFAHAYYGTCISGNKTLTFPRTRPCPHTFGWPCLLRYYPRRTGGLSPVTMLREYRRQAQRLRRLRDYRYIVVLSEHMRTEYVKHGLDPARVVRLPFPARRAGRGSAPSPDFTARPRQPSDPWQLLFVGRMDPLKGGAALLAAAPLAAQSLRTPIRVTLVGDGPARRRWETLAAKLCTPRAGATASFTGWLSEAEVHAWYRAAHLLVVPSLWPEPFGKAGLEAAAFGVPATAFAVGGIPEWLTDGVNGTLAPGDPPTPQGLAEATVRALRDPAGYQTLCRGALALGRATDEDRHGAAVLSVLERAAGAAAPA